MTKLGGIRMGIEDAATHYRQVPVAPELKGRKTSAVRLVSFKAVREPIPVLRFSSVSSA